MAMQKKSKDFTFKSDKNIPIVSVITVCRNAENTIAKTIESVLRQTYDQIEYIIIDGASTDETLDIIKQYEPKFKGRMRWISELDAGIYHAMNKGIKLAQGRIIGMINSDDWYEPDSVQLVANSYRKHRDAVYYGMLRVVEDNNEVMLKLVNYKYLHRDVVGHPAYFVTRSIYEKHGLYRLEYKIASDYEMMLRLIQRGVSFIQIDSILANFSYGGKSYVNEKKTIEEYLRIRYEYGYLTKRFLRRRLFRMKISSILDKIGNYLLNP